MKLQHGTDIRFDSPLIGCGKSGYGFYAYKSSSSAMKSYYDKGHILQFEVDDSEIVDLTTQTNYTHAKLWIESQLNKRITKSIFQQSGLMLHCFLNRFYPDAKAFVNFHFGYGLPTSKEIIVIDTNIIKNMQWIK